MRGDASDDNDSQDRGSEEIGGLMRGDEEHRYDEVDRNNEQADGRDHSAGIEGADIQSGAGDGVAIIGDVPKSIDYVIPDKEFDFAKGFAPRTRFCENIEAIELLKCLEQENRNASIDELAVLGEYGGKV